MIGFVDGKLLYKTSQHLIILTGGIGFKIFTTVDLINASETGQKISLFTYTHVKDDALDLYGFANPENLAMFELFLSVSGIGPKTAMSIFSAGKIERIKEAIVKGDVAFFSAVPRLGRKNAQKIIIELRSKLGSLGELDLAAESGESKEIIDALKSFGFSPSETKEALRSVSDSQGTTSDKIKLALKFLGRK
ncbi:MAG: Holliday junction DNA helicase RuvA, holliday junction DNA helicase RuvA [Candidatus Gottesmanbacteria bacterium GW2011_GWA2_43_14]|uniref:Holliday junction branch migration complex subunit RuvA n=1 Tax=Candidatus Gottesmanbacteria bacterium GW2011_GWA2_43_14 TaxID=1618443 RepID=A0A0G1DJI9_9BACT|nr:MAG: Holliday junction DNA helicase RuvA, holliday junction DNA helicase RuvA [Candidatus Gottesmanbacteria bacterium GW2011_GWA2_43_14]